MLLRFVILDTETTGIPDRHPNARITEIGAVFCTFDTDSRQLVIDDTFESLVNPGSDALDSAGEALRITQLTVEMLELAPGVPRVAAKLRKAILDYCPDRLAAYNVPFDFHPQFLGSRDWLAGECERYGKPLDLAVYYRTFKKLDRYAKGWRLDNALETFSVERTGTAHSALSDALMTAYLLPHLFPTDRIAPVPFTREDAMRELQEST